jgi:hypothetical protein
LGSGFFCGIPYLEKVKKQDRAYYFRQVMTDNVMLFLTRFIGKRSYKRFDLILQFGLIKPDFGIFSVCLKKASA